MNIRTAMRFAGRSLKPFDAGQADDPSKWKFRKLLSALAVGLAFVLGLLFYVGYIGGQVFTLVPASPPKPLPIRGVAAVLLSGDTGFRVGMGPRIAGRLAEDGIPVIGVNSLTYYRTRRSPGENAALINEATRRALALPGIDRVVLIGQSFGADMLQAGLPSLPAALRERVLLVALVVPGDTIDFRASPEELLNLEAPDMAALPTAQKLDWVTSVCIKGQLETDSLCPLLLQANVSHVSLPGGHMLHHDAAAVHDILLRAIRAAVHSRDGAAPIPPLKIHDDKKGIET